MSEVTNTLILTEWGCTDDKPAYECRDWEWLADELRRIAGKIEEGFVSGEMSERDGLRGYWDWKITKTNTRP